MENKDSRNDKDGLISRVVNVARVAKVIKGGRRFAFSALVIAGDGNGRVGYGSGKGREVAIAIQKAENNAKRDMKEIPLSVNTIPHLITSRKSAAIVMLKPASPGTGVIAGGTIRAIMDCAGVQDVLTKSMGSSNPVNIVKATISALHLLDTPLSVATRRGLSAEHVSTRSVVAHKNPETLKIHEEKKNIEVKE